VVARLKTVLADRSSLDRLRLCGLSSTRWVISPPALKLIGHAVVNRLGFTVGDALGVKARFSAHDVATVVWHTLHV
jgi:hypothetical protein